MENPQLTIADLASLHGVIEAACTRGAFKADEMTKVGQVYDKLTAFLQSIQTQAAEQAAQVNEPPQGEINA